MKTIIIPFLMLVVLSGCNGATRYSATVSSPYYPNDNYYAPNPNIYITPQPQYYPRYYSVPVPVPQYYYKDKHHHHHHHYKPKQYTPYNYEHHNHRPKQYTPYNYEQRNDRKYKSRENKHSHHNHD